MILIMIMTLGVERVPHHGAHLLRGDVLARDDGWHLPGLQYIIS